MSGDVAQLLDEKFKPILTKAKILKIQAAPSSKTMEHPLETGASIVDHRIITPTELTIQMVCNSADYKNVYEQLLNLYKKGTLFVVQSRVNVYENMLIESMPHEETPAMFDAVALVVKLKSVLIVQSKYVTAPKKPAQKQTVEQGVKQTEKKSEGSVLGAIFK